MELVEKFDRADGVRRPKGIDMTVSAEVTANGAAQSTAHNLGAVPTYAYVVPTDTAPATAGVFTVTAGTHTATNSVFTVTSGKKYRVVSVLRN